MSSNPCASIGGSCDAFIAPQFLGTLWSWCLYGALVVQFYVYSYNFPGDNRHTKLLVYSVFFLETVQTVLSGVDLYYWIVAGYGKLDHLFSPFASFLDLPIMGSMVSLSVQFFFAYRIFVLSGRKSRWLCAVICLFSFIGTSAAFGVGIEAYISGGFGGAPVGESLAMTWIAGNLCSDILIVSSMLYYLRRIWARDRSLNTSHIFVSIVKLTVETNLMTTTVCVISLIMLAMYPAWNWYVCPVYVLGKLYSNTLLVSLNNRISIRDSNESRGAAVDCQEMIRFKSSNQSGSTSGGIISEPEKRQEFCMNVLSPDAKLKEGVNIAVTIDTV